MRASELAGRAGKQPDGSSKTREVKLCTVWTAEARDDEGTPVRDPGSVTYSAAIESAASRDTDAQPSDFAQRVARAVRRRGFDHARRRVVLGDGALWIWNLAEEQFPGKGHLWDVAKAIDGAGSDLGEQWAKQRRDELDEGKIDAVLAALQVHAQGLCVSPGVVEAGCKVAIGTRLTRAGMHWTAAGADAIIALCCCRLSGRFEDFWERRSSAAAAGTG